MSDGIVGDREPMQAGVHDGPPVHTQSAAVQQLHADPSFTLLHAQ